MSTIIKCKQCQSYEHTLEYLRRKHPEIIPSLSTLSGNGTYTINTDYYKDGAVITDTYKLRKMSGLEE